MKPEKRTISIATTGGVREVQAEVYGDWVAVHRSWVKVGDQWGVSDATSGGYIVYLRLQKEARAFALDVAQTFSDPTQLGDNMGLFEELCGRHGLTTRHEPIGPARKVVGYETIHYGSREVYG